MWKWMQNLIDAVLWVFYDSKDRSLDLYQNGVAKDADMDKTKA